MEPDGSERVVQRSNTSLMVHRLPEIIAFLSLFTTLEAGDVIATGTPDGVGLGRKPPEFLPPVSCWSAPSTAWASCATR